MQAKVILSAVLGASAFGLAGCAAAGPIGNVDGSRVCLPSKEGTDVFFGSSLENTGTKDLEILAVSLEDSTNTATVEFGVDPARSTVGAGYFPDETNALPESLASIESRVDPADVVIEPGQTAGLLIKVVPDDATTDATVSEVKIKYQVGRTTHVATDKTVFVVSAAPCF